MEPFLSVSGYNSYDGKAIASQPNMARMAHEHGLCAHDIAICGDLAVPGWASLSARMHDAAYWVKRESKRTEFPSFVLPAEKQ